jgi:hypothetical protein
MKLLMSRTIPAVEAAFIETPLTTRCIPDFTLNSGKPQMRRDGSNRARNNIRDFFAKPNSV